MGWMGQEGMLGEEVLLSEICGLRGMIFLLRGDYFVGKFKGEIVCEDGQEMRYV